MRVALDARSLTAPVLRGMDRYLLGLSAGLRARGVEPVLLHRAGAPLHPAHAGELERRAIPARGGLHYEQVALPRALREFALYHAPAERGVPLRAPCPVVLSVHSATRASYRDLVRRGRLPGRVEDYLGPVGLPPWSPRRWIQPGYWRAQVRRADHLLAPSDFARDELVRLLGVPPSRVTTTPLGLPALFRREPAPPAARARLLDDLGVRPPYLLHVGGYEPHKNVNGLLRAFALVRSARPDLQLVGVGSRPAPRELEREARELGSVRLLAGLGEELLALYDGAALFWSLSWRESFGLPTLEALSRGLPVVCSAWGASPEVVGAHGRLVHPDDLRAASRAVLDLLAAPPDARARAARAEWARGFSWERTTAATLAVYRRLLETR